MENIKKLIKDFGIIPAIILILGLTIQIFYFLHTPYNIRSNDADDHIRYIEYVAQNFNIPHWNLCWECHQAPFYYILSAVVYKIPILFGINDTTVIYFILQIFSIFLFFIFSAVSVLIFKKIFITDKREGENNIALRNIIFYLVSAIFVFWPTNIINSSRITNDILFDVFYALVIFFLIRWFEKKDNKNFYFSLLFSFLAFITKAHGILAFALIGICAISIFIKDKRRFDNFKSYFKYAGILFIIFLVGFFGSRLGARTIDKIKGEGEKRNILVWNVGGGLNSLLYTENKAKNYIYFDSKIFLTEPYVNNWDDKYGRQYFWNFLLKNSLFGEFFFKGVVAENIAIGMSVLLLVIIFWIVGYMLFSVKESFKNNFILKVNAILLLFVFAVFKIVLGTNGDFRLILPILISLCSFVGVGFLEYRRRGLKNIEYIGYGIFSLFVILSVLFFIFGVFLEK